MLSLQQIKRTYNIVYCNSWFKKLRGLYFRQKNTLCIIPICKSVHTFLFFKHIDVAFLSEKNFVVCVKRNVRPWRLLFCNQAKTVVEKFTSYDEEFFSVGDNVKFEEVNNENLSSM